MYEFDVDYFEIHEEDWEAFEEGLAAELEEFAKEFEKNA